MRGRAWFVADLLCVGACGRIGFDPVDAALACPASYTQTPDGCYRVVTAPTGWIAAELDCEADRAHLVVLDSLDKHYVLHAMLATAGISASWLGLSDRHVESAFQWVTAAGLDPSSDRCYWGSSGPNGDGNSATNDCVTQATANSCPDWTVEDCGSLRPFVCEHDGTPADPTRY